MSETLVTLEHIEKRYPFGDKDFVAISDVCLDLRSGEFVALLGPSGCGKSTLLRIIAGLQRATQGKVLYRGQELDGVNPNTMIVFQSFALFPWLTVVENVELPLKAKGIPRAERYKKALKLIDTVGLDGFEAAYPRELSGGMRQKVGFARAMAVEPELLCLDEPFSALDILSAEALRGELIELWLNKSIPTKAVLLVTHSIEEAVMLADRIIVMSKEPGRVIAEISVGLKHPRARKEATFQAIVDRVYSLVTGKSGRPSERSEQQSGWPKLPTARLNALAGLVEKLAEEGGKADIPLLSSSLAFELDDLLPIVEVGEMLGFIEAKEGDLHLSSLGEVYAEASILARKELVAKRVLRVPLIRWLFNQLQNAENQRIGKEVLIEQLSEHYGELAEQQLDVSVLWARYAELFSFDDDSRELFLE